MKRPIDTTANPSCGTCQRYLRSPTAKQWGLCVSARTAPAVVTVGRTFNQHFSNGGPRCPGYLVRTEEDLQLIKRLDTEKEI